MLYDALRMIRIFHDVQQKELAGRLHIAPSYLSEIEKGKKQPSLQLLQEYAEIFRMPLSSILFFSERMEDGNPADRVRLNVSGKVLALLKFIAARRSECAHQ